MNKYEILELVVQKALGNQNSVTAIVNYDDCYSKYTFDKGKHRGARCFHQTFDYQNTLVYEEDYYDVLEFEIKYITKSIELEIVVESD